MIIKIRIVRIKSRGSILLKIVMIKSATLYMFKKKIILLPKHVFF